MGIPRGSRIIPAGFENNPASFNNNTASFHIIPARCYFLSSSNQKESGLRQENMIDTST